jgi:hypothetical protein
VVSEQEAAQAKYGVDGDLKWGRISAGKISKY